MARPRRIEFAGATYHVTSRGDRREPVFVDDQDRQTFLEALGLALTRMNAVALADPHIPAEVKTQLRRRYQQLAVVALRQ